MKWVALIEEREVAGEVFFRVLLPASGSVTGGDDGYINLFGRAVVRGRLGWVPADTLELASHTSVTYTESYAGESGVPIPAALTASFRCWMVPRGTVDEPQFTPNPY